jgi:metal-sulfur cluster biosynthetic enzyme
MTTTVHVLAVLDGVYDPELDEPITGLGFVSSCEVSSDGDVAIRLRLPTPQCAPNFAYLMAADAQDAVRRLPGVRGVNVVLEDHYTGDEINASLARGGGFAAAFPGETSDDDDLSALREVFRRKALVARQARICEMLLGEGETAERLCRRTVADLPDTADGRRCVQLRGLLGISRSPEAPAFVLPDGTAITVEQLQRWLRVGRLIRMSLEANGGICRSLLSVRYKLGEQDEVLA